MPSPFVAAFFQKEGSSDDFAFRKDLMEALNHGKTYGIAGNNNEM